MPRLLACGVLCCLLLITQNAWAELRLAQVFQDNMVLQRDLKVPVWGWADRGTAVSVSFAGQTHSGVADDKGRWEVKLAPLQTSAKGQSLIVSAGTDRVERKNVLVGEVWVLSGQSNMARPLRNDSIDYPFFKDYSNDAEYPQVRFTNFGFGASSTPLDDVEPFMRKASPWKVLSKSVAHEVMSIGFFFAKRIAKELDVPVGLVQVAVSGTPQTSWMARETLESFPGEDGAANYYQTAVAGAEDKLARSKSGIKSFADYEGGLNKWRSDPAATERTWPGDAVVTDFPSVLYNTRVHPLAPFAFRGMLWHQGEAGPGGAYGPRMVAMIKHHRALFKNDFYFVFGTLTRKTTVPPPLAPQVTVFGSINQSMIEGDRLFGKDGKAALVNFFDLGNTATHWAMKEEAGRRMSLAALDVAYARPHVFTGPQLIRSAITGSTAACTFRHAGSGLKYEPSVDGISGVVLIDKKGTRHWADVKVTGADTLQISHPKGGDIASVHYGLHSNPHETLFNDAGFAAFAFSSGGFTGKTEDPVPLIQVTANAGKAELNVSHVRRSGYVFDLVELRAQGGEKVAVRAYVPTEWKGVEVRAGDQLVEAGQMTEDGGRKFVTVEAVVNGPPVIVAEKGKSEALTKVRRF